METAIATRPLEAFIALRPLLHSIAYRMLGSAMEAEDVVQEAYLRWQGASETDVRSHRAYLVTIVTRLSINQLRSARVQRETYVGPWLPQPRETSRDCWLCSPRTSHSGRTGEARWPPPSSRSTARTRWPASYSARAGSSCRRTRSSDVPRSTASQAWSRTWAGNPGRRWCSTSWATAFRPSTSSSTPASSGRCRTPASDRAADALIAFSWLLYCRLHGCCCGDSSAGTVSTCTLSPVTRT